MDILQAIKEAWDKAIGEEVNRYYEQAKQATPFTTYGKSPLEDVKAYAAKYPTWDKIVEGSVVHPVDDPARLLEGGKDDERGFCEDCGCMLDYSETNICWFCLQEEE